MAKYTVVTIEYFDGPRKGQRMKWRICQACGEKLDEWLLNRGGAADAVRDVPEMDHGAGADG